MLPLSSQLRRAVSSSETEEGKGKVAANAVKLFKEGRAPWHIMSGFKLRNDVTAVGSVMTWINSEPIVVAALVAKKGAPE